MSNRNTHTKRPRHFDASGHLAPAQARHLLELGRATNTTDSIEAFIASSCTDDDLAEELAEAAVTSMTSGEDALFGALDADVVEEHGGPFVETSGGTEFASGTDESNIAEATREPFPRANGSGQR